LPDHHQIATLAFRNSEIKGEMLHERKAIFDYHCESQIGKNFIVEMQKAKAIFFKDRSLC
jgi:hypothetical protein